MHIPNGFATANARTRRGTFLHLPALALLSVILPGLVAAQTTPATPRGSMPPVLSRMLNDVANRDGFRQKVREAVEQHPGVLERIAREREAKGARREAQAGLLPTVDVNFTGDASIFRDFEDELENIVEETRPVAQGILQVQSEQLLYDFGATRSRIRSADARLSEAREEVAISAGDIALTAIEAHVRVVELRTLIALSQQYVARHATILDQVEERFEEGFGALRDVARVKARLARAEADVATATRQLAGAESRYIEVFGNEPASVLRPLPPPSGAPTLATAQDMGADLNPQARAAIARARADEAEFDAVRAQNRPSVSVALNATKFDLFEFNEDFDLRAQFLLRYNLYNGGANRARISQSRERFRQAQFARQRADQEIRRDVTIAYREREVLVRQLGPLERAVTANDEARAIYLEQFRVARGSLIDVLQAEQDFFESAVALLRGLIETDIASYRLLAETGELLDLFGISFSFAGRRDLFGGP
ncbi:MAG: TolC family protein [Pseudomonadota bacterium]